LLGSSTASYTHALVMPAPGAGIHVLIASAIKRLARAAEAME
jgi:hypothetical protein